MRSANVYCNHELAGVLTKEDDGIYTFRYTEDYYVNPSAPAISLTLPKTQQEYKSDILFPFFSSLLAEGVNRKLQCRRLKIDERDDFSLLLATAGSNTIGAVTVRPIQS
ncbi:MAG TPA: HipA N-terminal domain-containing protein [Cytophagaceae bacterium]|jgi:serine/threonine-protein kinase HipA|nr:HipA N-terminal domain-containing protein [Cytophagaceae bacterium]